MEITTKGTTAAKNSFKKSNYYECVCLTKLHHFTFFHLYKVWNNLYHGWVGRVQTKYTMLCFHLLFWLFYVVAVVFHHTFFVFIIFIFFFWWSIKFRILSYQTSELVVSNCQWNCILTAAFVYPSCFIYYHFANLYRIITSCSALVIKWHILRNICR